MNKTEAHFKKETGFYPKPDRRITADGCIDLMESYADQVSRERAIKFAVEIMTPYTTDYPSILKARFKNKYDKWREQK